MNELLALFWPRLLSFRNGSFSRNAGNRRIRYLLFAAIGLAFWVGAFLIFYRILNYFQGIEEFGDILARKLLSMVLLTFFSLLLFSGIVASLSKLYLSRDLLLVHSLPVSYAKIFLARWLESTVDSSVSTTRTSPGTCGQTACSGCRGAGWGLNLISRRATRLLPTARASRSTSARD